jgi:hypothetical protein
MARNFEQIRPNTEGTKSSTTENIDTIGAEELMQTNFNLVESLKFFNYG